MSVHVHENSVPVHHRCPACGGVMIININLPGCADVAQALTQLTQKVDAIGRKEDTEMSLLDDLSTDVADLTTVEDSAVALLGNLSAQLAAAGTDPVKLQAIKDALDTGKANLAAAVVANTPAVPAPPTPPTA